MNNPEGFLPQFGGYKKLLSYQRSLVVFDATVKFCDGYFKKFDRTVDQMVQAARSGKQNIIEASMASGTSKETELKLTNVARASLEELLEDYRDILRKENLNEWPKENSYALRLRELNKTADANYETFRRGVEHQDLVIRVNVIIGLIKVTSFYLHRQILSLEADFLKNGGLREAMSKARRRAKNDK
jgi:four helix bundle suffix protein